MERAVLIAVLALAAIQCYGAVQVQMPETAELQMEDSDLQAQIKELQRNVSDIWTYIYELRSAVSQHLTHLRQHQVEIESTVHKMEHLHEDSHSHGSSHGDSHHHSGDDHHSHSGEQHSHGDDHGSHGDDHHHSHSGEQHSHSGEQHSHSGEHHSHSGEHGHHSHSYSHSHSHGGHDHSKEDSSHSSHSHDESDHHHHDHDRKDSHETEDLTQTTQQVQQVSPPVAEPVVVPANRREHYHHHHHHESRSGTPSGMNLMGEHGFHSHHHHGHQDSTSTTSSSSKNRTVILPRYSDYDQYDFATCNVQPNRAISEELQQDVEGAVTLWQKKTGGPLNFHVRLQGFKIGDHHGHHGAHQAIQQEEDNETPQEAGHRHGFHIHASGDLSNGCQSTGPHYNPKTVNHGGPTALVRHIGDLGNIECDNHGITNILFSDDLASLRGQYSVIGKAIVIHSDLDDLGQGGDEESLKTGNAGTRIACCVIQKVNKLPIRNYRAMKTAIQYQNR